MIRLNRIIEQNKEKSLFAVTNMLLLFSDSGNKLSKCFPCWVCKQFGSHIWRELIGLPVFHQIISIDFLSS